MVSTTIMPTGTRATLFISDASRPMDTHIRTGPSHSQCTGTPAIAILVGSTDISV